MHTVTARNFPCYFIILLLITSVAQNAKELGRFLALIMQQVYFSLSILHSLQSLYRSPCVGAHCHIYSSVRLLMGCPMGSWRGSLGRFTNTYHCKQCTHSHRIKFHWNITMCMCALSHLFQRWAGDELPMAASGKGAYCILQSPSLPLLHWFIPNKMLLRNLHV